MNKKNIGMSIVIGLMAGQVFSEGERPLKVSNTVRVNYSDNRYFNDNDKEETFVTDVVDLSFKAALSDRTTLTVKSKLDLLNDSDGSDVYPDLYTTLDHSVSPRWLLGLSEYFQSGQKAGADVNTPADNARYNYFENKVGASADYVLTAKDRLQGLVNYSILRHDREIETLDQTTMGGGLNWKRDLVPQRTFSTLSLGESQTTYDNNTMYHDAHYEATKLTVGLNQTFNQQWQGSVKGGGVYVQRHFSAKDEASMSPTFDTGVAYSPSPRTKLTGDFSVDYGPSADDNYGGQNTAEVRFGAQHDLTGKLTAKASASFANAQYNEKDRIAGTATDKTEKRKNVDLRLSYQVHRMHFVEAGVSRKEKDYDTGADYSENRVDLGWRVELN